MTAIILNEDPKAPLPQVPDWVKAEQLFRTRYHYAVTSAHGMERFAFRVLPYSLIRSFALTFDPTTPFRLGSERISPVNRTRTRTISSVSFARKALYRNSTSSRTLNPNANTCQYVPAVESTYQSGFDSSLFQSMPKLKWTAKDTTRRTRGPYQDMGEFEQFSYSLSSPDRSVTRTKTYNQCVTNDTCHLPGLQTQRTVETRSTLGGAAVISDSTLSSLRSQVITAVNQAMTKHAPAMVSATLPMARRFNFAREVFELKDLPRSVTSLYRTAQDLSSAYKAFPRSGKEALKRAKLSEHVPNEYLSYWFGWVLLAKTVRELLELPEKISKEVNFLISRRGKPTTLRRSRKIGDVVLTTPGWSYDPSSFSGTLWSETTDELVTTNTLEIELRIVINCLFDFPEVGVPKLRSELLDRKWGVRPTATDIYNVIPWTWLLDWFTGLGNYVEMIDVVNTDKSLVNWGVLSGKAKGSLRTTLRTHYDNHSQYAYSHNGSGTTTDVYTRVNTSHTSVLDYQAIVRKDIVNSYGVRSVLKPSSMTTYQQSIIGALLAQRSGISRL